MKGVTFLTLALLSVAAAVPKPREGRDLIPSFSLFSVVNFPNEECQPTTSGLKDITGTCFSSTECSNMGGSNSGKCGAGFGVCCTFVVDKEGGGNVKQNNTVVENEKYPTPFTAATKTVTYTITPVSTDICALRFDFIAFDTGITAVTGACADTFTIDSQGKDPPVLCGMNAGYHVYSHVDQGTTSSTSATMVTSADATLNRTWRIKIAQIECSSPSRPNSGCLQYFTAPSGGFESFNFMGGLIPQGMDYSVCFKKSKGMCGIRFKTDEGSDTPDPFFIDDGATAAMAKIAGNCMLGRIVINGQAQCGTFLNPIDGVAGSASISAPLPFMTSVWTKAMSQGSSTGFKLLYSTSSDCPC